jgi:hypothetical protein
MDPHFWQGEASMKRYASFYGHPFYKDIMLIHEADKEAR